MATTIYAPPPIFNMPSFSIMDRHSPPSSSQQRPFAAYFRDQRSASPCEDTSIQDLSEALSAHSIRPRRSFNPPPPQPQRQQAIDEHPLFDEAPVFTMPNYQAVSSPVDSAYSSTRSNSIISWNSSFEPVKGQTRRSYSTSEVRRQRQRALRTQCSSDHLKEVSALVARMVARGEQCNICDARGSGIADGALGSDCGDDENEDMSLDGYDSASLSSSRPGTSGHDSGRRTPSFRSRERTADFRASLGTVSKDSGIRKSQQQQRRKRTKS